LVADEVARHAAHEADEGPEGDGVVLHDGVDGGKEVGHSLHVSEVLGVGIACVGVRWCRRSVVLEVG
jgi:hypothetical protein